jgi:hypothetical protein
LRTCRKQLYERKQLPNESGIAYYTSKMELIRKADPHEFWDESNRVLMIIEGLETNLGRFVDAMNPKSLADLRDVIVCQDSYKLK